MKTDRRRFLQATLIGLGLALAPIPKLALPSTRSLDVEFQFLSGKVGCWDPIDFRGRTVGRITDSVLLDDGVFATGFIEDPEAIAMIEKGSAADFSIGYDFKSHASIGHAS